MSFIYSIIPIEKIMGTQEQGFASNSLVEMEYKGKKVLAYRDNNGFILERLLSTDLGDYLSPEYQPGQRI